MKKIFWIIVVALILGGLGFYFLSSNDYLGETVPQPPSLPDN